MRSEKEISRTIEAIEVVYPPGRIVWGNPIGNYNLGILAGLRIALGEYQSPVEMDMQEFFEKTFPLSTEKAENNS